MQQTQFYFLRLLRSYILDESPEQYENMDLDGLLALADLHGITPIIYNRISRLPAFAEYDRQKAEDCKKRCILAEYLQSLRTSEFLLAYEALREAGAKPLLVKGLYCRNLYDILNLRTSCDEDLVIRAKDFQPCHRALLEEGLTCLDDEFADRQNLNRADRRQTVSYRGKKRG